MRKRVVFIYNSRLALAEPLAKSLSGLVESIGASWEVFGVGDESSILDSLKHADLAVALGGDGTILRAGRLSLNSRTPVVAVNLGELGFLAEVEPDDAPSVLPRLLAGEGWVEERLVVSVSARDRSGAPLFKERAALNDLFVGRGELSRVARVTVEIGGEELASFVGDGVIVATPTGSTAYSLAAGGPILDPRLRSCVITPVSPYLSFPYPVVTEPDAEIRLVVSSDHGAGLTIDGQSDAVLPDGAVVAVRPDSRSVRFLRLRSPGEFYRDLRRHLRPDHFWSDASGRRA